MNRSIIDFTDLYRILNEYFVIDKIFDLCNYDSQMELLYLELQKLKKSSYEKNYRFVFLLYETQYYISPNVPGLTLLNLHHILTKLDIPTYFCLIVSCYDLKNELKIISAGSTDIVIDSVQSFMFMEVPKDFDIKLNFDKIYKKYLCLNRASRFHRHFLVALLNLRNLLDKGLVSYLNTKSVTNLDNNCSKVNDGRIKILTTVPFSRINESINISPHYYNIVDNWYQKNKEFLNFDNDLKNFLTYTSNFYQEAFVHLVTNTAYEYPTMFISEKVFKPILNKRPFIYVGQPGLLSFLKESGFKTFSDFWDESYDETTDPTERMIKIVDIVDNICNLTDLEIVDLANSMSATLEFNFNHYITTFNVLEINKLNTFCKNNLCSR